MRRLLPWAAGAALVVAAGVVTAVTPDAGAQNAPFLVRGAMEQTVTARNLIVRVDGATFADRITVADDDWEAAGNWLVVDLSAAARTTEVDAELMLVKLVADGREFIASERPSTSLVGSDLRVGLGTGGTVAFELPADVVSGAGELRLSLPYATPHLDDVIVVPLDLDGVPRTGSIDIVEPVIEGMP
jgi:hypothetical protein